MGNYKTVPLGDLIELKKGKKASSTTPNPTIKSSRYIQITDLRDDQKIVYTEDKKGTRVCQDDLIIAWDGANAGTVSYGLEGLIGSTLTRLRPTNSTFYTPYAGQFLQSRFRLLRNSCSGATIPHIQADVLKSLKISLPPLAEQKRIAAMLDKAGELRRKRRESIAALDSLTQSIFLDLFGDPVTNPKKFRTTALSKCGSFVSGGTPPRSSKTYWNGTYPWVSPKDMKRINIEDSIEHINDVVFEETPLTKIPEKSLLIVVRGMILAHTVPIAITRRPVAINQDMKALIPQEQINADFLLFNLLSQHSSILAQVATAAHGTKRIETRVLNKLPVLLPPKDLQEEFAKRCTAIQAQRTRLLSAQVETDNLFTALQQKAFA